MLQVDPGHLDVHSVQFGGLPQEDLEQRKDYSLWTDVLLQAPDPYKAVDVKTGKHFVQIHTC